MEFLFHFHLIVQGRRSNQLLKAFKDLRILWITVGYPRLHQHPCLGTLLHYLLCRWPLLLLQPQHLSDDLYQVSRVAAGLHHHVVYFVHDPLPLVDLLLTVEEMFTLVCIEG